VVHFYEGFLKAYDPAVREMRGVYYTPEPVVSYIVRSIDHLLKSRFNRPDGLADRNTLILDPACGTATFLFSVVKLIYQTLESKGRRGGWSDYTAKHLLPRLFGFELLMAPYAVAHLKMETLLRDLGYEFTSGQRLGIYLTNTLEQIIQEEQQYGMTQFLAQEGREASRVKNQEPIEVILGNPPYSGISVNRGKWITGLIKDYMSVDGKPLGERKLWLQDDYVKFLRFGQWRIEKTGCGVLAMITNHGYLDNPTFRGMRQSLMETFSDIYVLDLHGSSKKREKAPGGIQDKNVFDIQQGVAVGIFVKAAGHQGPAKVRHAELWGEREGKYAWLAAQDVSTTAWQELEPRSPDYLFVPADTSLKQEYEQGWRVPEIFPLNCAGIITSRDGLVIDVHRDALERRLEAFADVSRSDDEIRATYFPRPSSDKYPPGDTRSWKLPKARQRLRADSRWKERIRECLYRPLDIRSFLYADYMVDWPRPEVMGHMLAGDNLALATTRSIEIGRGFEHIFCTRALLTHHSVSLKEVNYLYPLYLTPSEGQGQHIKRQPNLGPDFLKAIAGKLSYQPTPEDIFHYIYAVLHSPTYRSRYAEFLKRDFPRVPLTSDRALFEALAAKGAELVALHLLESPALQGPPVVRFDRGNGNLVEKVRYDEARQRVYINKEQWFEGVKPEVWNFHIGGYRVCEKWLKDRKGRPLIFADVAHYQKVVKALAETIRLMAEIDGLISKWPLS
jgi:predicted helicase